MMPGSQRLVREKEEMSRSKTGAKLGSALSKAKWEIAMGGRLTPALQEKLKHHSVQCSIAKVCPNLVEETHMFMEKCLKTGFGRDIPIPVKVSRLQKLEDATNLGISTIGANRPLV